MGEAERTAEIRNAIGEHVRKRFAVGVLDRGLLQSLGPHLVCSDDKIEAALLETAEILSAHEPIRRAFGDPERFEAEIDSLLAMAGVANAP